jgi:hypothetical protein
MLVALCALAACSGAKNSADSRGSSSATAGAGNPLDNPSGLTRSLAACSPACMDFPSAPLFDPAGPGAPSVTDANLFGAPDNFTSPGACVIEPQLSQGKLPGSLFPSNWLRPRFRWTPLPGENVWEIRISALNQKNTLVAYTTATVWTLPREIWMGLGANSTDSPITVTIRGLNRNAPQKPSGTRGDFTIAPAQATGKLVYWATTSSEVQPTTSKLVGFDVGDESVIDALTIPQVAADDIVGSGGRDLRGKNDDPYGVAPGHVQCIGCHVSAPDGDSVAFTDHWPWNTMLASVVTGSIGQTPSYVSTGAALLLNQPWLGMPTFSKAHFSQGDRILVSVYSPRNAGQGAAAVGFSDGAPYPSRTDGLAWFDLETTATFATDPSQGDVQQQLNQQVRAQFGQAFGLFTLTGEKRSAATPSLSHDGTRIVYTSADTTQDGRISSNNQEVDVRIVPYNARQGGTVTDLKGAADPQVAEYYPSFSADDSLVAFNRVAKLDSNPIYYRPDGEIYVVPSAGGTATRLAANDPPACTGQSSPGVINSWAKWSPSVTDLPSINVEFGSGPRTYFWLVFSSGRAFDGQFQLPKSQSSPSDTRSSQLYVSAVVRDDVTHELQTFPAIYIWNQGTTTSNLTPAWDEFHIPPVRGPD